MSCLKPHRRLKADFQWVADHYARTAAAGGVVSGVEQVLGIKLQVQATVAHIINILVGDHRAAIHIAQIVPAVFVINPDGQVVAHASQSGGTGGFPGGVLHTAVIDSTVRASSKNDTGCLLARLECWAR